MYYIKSLKKLLKCEYSNSAIIITGYLGPVMIEEFFNLNPNIKELKIYVGMMSDLSEPFKKSLNKYIIKYKGKLKIFFTKRNVHIKTYIFLKDKKIVKCLNGSANFSSNGFYSNIEALSIVDVNNKFVKIFKKVIEKDILINSYLFIYSKDKNIEKLSSSNVKFEKDTLSWSLLSNKNVSIKNILKRETHNNEMSGASNLNWGLSNGYPRLNDAYFKIPSEALKKFPGFFKTEKNSNIDVIWPDGVSMVMKLEGKQKINGIEGPKQISVVKDKSYLGIYIRNILEKKLGTNFIFKEEKKEDVIKNPEKYMKYQITKKNLEEAGLGTKLNLRKIGEKIYEIWLSK